MGTVTVVSFDIAFIGAPFVGPFVISYRPLFINLLQSNRTLLHPIVQARALDLPEFAQVLVA